MFIQSSACDPSSPAYASCLRAVNAPDGYQGGSSNLMVVLIVFVCVAPILSILVWYIHRKWEDRHPDKIKYVGNTNIRRSTVVGIAGAAIIEHQLHNGGPISSVTRDLQSHDAAYAQANALNEAQFQAKYHGGPQP